MRVLVVPDQKEKVVVVLFAQGKSLWDVFA